MDTQWPPSHFSVQGAAHLPDGLAAVRVDPERSGLDGFLGVNLRDGPLHLVHQSPARCVADTQRQAVSQRQSLLFLLHS